MGYVLSMYMVVTIYASSARSEKVRMKVLGTLNEYQVSLFVAARAIELGRGGITHLARLTRSSGCRSLPATRCRFFTTSGWWVCSSQRILVSS